MSKLKRKNLKTKTEQIKKLEDKLCSLPVDGFVIIDDPDYLIDDIFGCY